MNIAFFTASRADYGKLKPVILEAKKKKIKFQNICYRFTFIERVWKY